MRSTLGTMRPALLPLILALTTAVPPLPLEGQLVDDQLVPAGHLRIQASPSFSSWDERFGRTPDGSSGRSPLGAGLTSSAALSLFPGASSLADALGELTGAPAPTLLLGASDARVTHDLTRIELGAHLGVTDWLTLGVIAPRVQGRAAIDVIFQPDSVNGNLGVHPSQTNPVGVNAFRSSLAQAAASADARATQLCASDPGQCPGAQQLAARVAAFRSLTEAAYGATPFFPLTGTPIATALGQAQASLDLDLTSVGLAGLPVPFPLATERVDAAAFAVAPTSTVGDLGTTPLQGRVALWDWGDIELSATIRLLEGRIGGNETGTPTLSYRVLGGGVVRLGTGMAPDPDVLFDLGTGDGQTDVEGRIHGFLGFGSRGGVHLGARYGTQGSRRIVRRIAEPWAPLAPLSSRVELRWSPAAYVGLEVAPSIQVTRELSLTAEYRLFDKGEDRYDLVSAVGGAGTDLGILIAGSSYRREEVGVGLRLDTVEPWRAGDGARPMQLHARVLHTFDGSGGSVPAATAVEVGLRLILGLWGAR